MSEHPKEPWDCGRIPEEPDTCVVGADGMFFARVGGIPEHPSEATTRRIVACVNACAGLDTDALNEVARIADVQHRMRMLSHHALVHGENK